LKRSDSRRVTAGLFEDTEPLARRTFSSLGNCTWYNQASFYDNKSVFCRLAWSFVRLFDLQRIRGINVSRVSSASRSVRSALVELDKKKARREERRGLQANLRHDKSSSPTIHSSGNPGSSNPSVGRSR
jgi:hypothetical protein